MEIAGIFGDLQQLLYVEKVQLTDITRSLKVLTETIRSEQSRESLESVHWKLLSELSTRACLCLKSSVATEELDFICELFRSLRNSCAGSFRNQQYVMSNQDILSNSASIFSHFAEHHNGNSTDKEISVLNCCLQFFGNAIYQNDKIKDFVWVTLYKTEILGRLLQSSQAKVREYSMMVLYNCITVVNTDDVMSIPEGQKMVLLLVDSLRENLIDWGVFLLETFMKSEEFMSKCYDILPLDSRLLILDLIAETLEKSSEAKAYLPACSVGHIANSFTTDAMDIVKICSTTIQDLRPLEISKMLCVLCAASVHDHYSRIVKSNPKLLEIALDVLKCVHLLGKSGNNAFSSLSNIKEVRNVEKDEMEQSPAYGFKKNLIRLIGNMCSECRENQDLVRTMDGIPLLLDCCCLDARNPYIMQWCILAIRNLLEKNKENQEIVAKISITGDLVDSALLRELGLEVYMQDGKPVLKKYVNSDNS